MADTMLSADLIKEWLRAQQESRAGWEEPHGHLVPTEPSRMARHLIRMRLDVQIATLMRVLGYPRAQVEAIEKRTGV